MEQEKKNNSLIQLIVILIIFVFVLSGYIVYDKVLNNKETPINETDFNIVTENSDDNTEIEEDRDYIYFCLKEDAKKGDKIDNNTFFTCSFDEEIPNQPLSSSKLSGYQIDFSSTDKNYYIKTDKKKDEVMMLDDFYWDSEEMTEKEDTNGFGEKLRIYIENGKLYYSILQTNKTLEIFNSEPVKYFTYEKEGGAGAFQLLLITTNNNVYYEKQLIGFIEATSDNYNEDYITFEKVDMAGQEVEKIVASIKVKEMNGRDFYALDKSNNLHLINRDYEY